MDIYDEAGGSISQFSFEKAFTYSLPTANRLPELERVSPSSIR
jgi:hypothetical protein